MSYSVFATGHRSTVGVCTYLAPPPSSRVRVRKSEKERASCGDARRDDRGLKRVMYGVENVRTSLRDSLRHLWECYTSFSSDALLRFRIVTQPSFSRLRHPRALRQRESMSMRVAMPCTRSGEDKESENAEMMIEST